MDYRQNPQVSFGLQRLEGKLESIEKRRQRYLEWKEVDELWKKAEKGELLGLLKEKYASVPRARIKGVKAGATRIKIGFFGVKEVMRELTDSENQLIGFWSNESFALQPGIAQISQSNI